MYKYALTAQDQLQLRSGPAMQEPKRPKAADLKAAKELKITEVDILQEYMSREEKEAMQREKDYMEKGAGKVEAILNEEMARLFANMEDKMRKQDEEFQQRMAPPKK